MEPDKNTADGTELRLRPYAPDRDFDILKTWMTDERAHALWCAGRTPFPLERESFDALLEYEREAWDNIPLSCETQEGRLVGFLCCSPDKNTKTVMLKFVVVDSSLRGQGTGRKLVTLAADYAFDILGAEAARLMVFSANTAARKCYLHAGFTEVSEDPGAFKYGGESWGRCCMMKYKK